VSTAAAGWPLSAAERLRLIVQTDAANGAIPIITTSDFEWIYCPEPGSCPGTPIQIQGGATPRAWFRAPKVTEPRTLRVVLAVKDDGSPPLTRDGHLVITVAPEPAGRP